jgi:hypothetical protein
MQDDEKLLAMMLKYNKEKIIYNTAWSGARKNKDTTILRHGNKELLKSPKIWKFSVW